MTAIDRVKASKRKAKAQRGSIKAASTFDLVGEGITYGKERNMSENESKQVPCISSLGLSVHYTLEVGCWVAWLRFQASDGSDAVLNLHSLAETKGSIVRNAILQWCEDHQPNSERLPPQRSGGRQDALVGHSGDQP